VAGASPTHGAKDSVQPIEAAAYGWDELARATDLSWRLDAYLPLEAFSALQEQLNQLDINDQTSEATADEPTAAEQVLLRAVDEPWPFPPNYPIAPFALAALDLLDYPDQAARRIAHDVLHALGETKPLVLARRSAKARATTGPLLGILLDRKNARGPRPRVEGDPRSDTRAAAAHLVGVLLASAPLWHGNGDAHKLRRAIFATIRARSDSRCLRR
jgi:hypothetical protein